MPERALPRALIVSINPIRNDQSNGILMRSLWRGWPKDRLRQVFFTPSPNGSPDQEVCGEYHRIDPIGRCRRLAEPSAQETDRKRPAISTIVAKQPRLVKGYARAAWELWASRVPSIRAALARLIVESRSEVVYALAGNCWMTRVTLDACRSTNTPLHLHVTDDFVESLYQGSPLGSALIRESTKTFQDAVDYAGGRSAISPIMAEEYRRRYGGQWDSFTTLINPNQYDTAPRRPDGVVRLLYAGGIRLDRWRALIDLAERLRPHQDRVELVVHAPPEHLADHGAALGSHPVVRIAGWASPESLPERFRGSDILIHVESPSTKQAAYTRWSFSTKLSQYMMAGRPILAFGPRGLASLKIVAQSGSGVVIDPTEGDQGWEQLERLIDDAPLRSSLASRGRAWALEHYDARTGSARFTDSIRRSAGTASLPSDRAA